MNTINPTQYEYGQTPLQKQIVGQNQIIKQMSDPRNKEFYQPKDLIAAQDELERLIERNKAEQFRLAKPPSYPDGGSNPKRCRRKSKSHRKYHRKSHKKSRKH